MRTTDRERLEHLCRYLLRPPLASDRLEALPDGDLLLRLKTRWSDGTTHLRLSPQELLGRLAALIPRPRVNMLLYHGVLGARARWRSRIVPAAPPTGATPATAAPSSRTNHIWAELMRRGGAVPHDRARRLCACPRTQNWLVGNRSHSGALEHRSGWRLNDSGHLQHTIDKMKPA